VVVPLPPPLTRRRWSYVQALDKRTAVGVARPVDLQRVYRSPTGVPNSHDCGRVFRQSRPAADVGVMYVRWTSAQPLELLAPWISNVCTDLQRVYLTLTTVGGCSDSPAPPQTLELCTYVGQVRSRWSCTPRGSPTCVPISNARTQLSRLWEAAIPGPDRSVCQHAMIQARNTHTREPEDRPTRLAPRSGTRS
jgi:hypothetical protein